MSKDVLHSSHSNILHNSQKVEGTQVSTDRWMDVIQLLKKDVLTHVAHGLKDIMERKIRQLQKNKYCVISLI